MRKLLLLVLFTGVAFGQGLLQPGPFIGGAGGGGGTPSGPAGGALTGTYPDPTIANLTTVGAIPYVSSSGVLSQDQTAAGQLWWDSTNHGLHIGNATASAYGLSITKSSDSQVFLNTPSGQQYTSLYFANNGTQKGYVYWDNSDLSLITGSSGSLGLWAGSSAAARIIASTRNFIIGGIADGNYKFDVVSSGSTGTARFYDQTATTGATLVTISKGASQSASSNTLVSDASSSFYQVTATGQVVSPYMTFNALGYMGANGDGIFALYNNAGNAFARLQFGGTTSSFGGIARDGAGLRIVTADSNTAYSFLGVSNLRVAGSSSGLVTVQGAAAAGTWSFTLPTSGGTSGYFLSTNGSGVSSWADVGTALTGVFDPIAAAQVFPAGSMKTFTPSAALPAMTISAGTIPTGILTYPGALFVTAAGLYGGDDGANVFIIPEVLGSGATAPTAPTSGRCAFWGSAFTLTNDSDCNFATDTLTVTKYTGGQLLVTGIVDGKAPIDITTGATANLGGTYLSGYTFNQESTAGTEVTYTLPPTAAGKQYCVKNSDVTGTARTGVLTVAVPTSSYLHLNGVRGTISSNITSGGAAGDAACFVANDATNWEVYVQVGTWTLH